MTNDFEKDMDDILDIALYITNKGFPRFVGNSLKDLPLHEYKNNLIKLPGRAIINALFITVDARSISKEVLVQLSLDPDCTYGQRSATTVMDGTKCEQPRAVAIVVHLVTAMRRAGLLKDGFEIRKYATRVLNKIPATASTAKAVEAYVRSVLGSVPVLVADFSANSEFDIEDRLSIEPAAFRGMQLLLNRCLSLK